MSAPKRIRILDPKNIPSPHGGGAWEVQGEWLVQTELPTANAPTKSELAALAKAQADSNMEGN